MRQLYIRFGNNKYLYRRRLIIRIMREIDTIVKDAMIAFGFVLKGSSWYKFTDDFVQVLNFQKSSFSNLYYLNVGIDTRSHSKLQYLPECRFGVRLRADSLIPETDLLIALDFQSEMDPAERTETICSIVGKCHSFLDSVSSWAQLHSAYNDDSHPIREAAITDVFKLIQELRKFDSSIVSFGDAASERQISETEGHIGRALPVEYKEFVRRHNGLDFTCEYILRVGNDVQPVAYSMNDVYDFEHFEACNPMPPDLIPFAPDGYGNHYCFDMAQNGAVVFWQHDLQYGADQHPDVVYRSMTEMIREVFICWSEL